MDHELSLYLTQNVGAHGINTEYPESSVREISPLALTNRTKIIHKKILI